MRRKPSRTSRRTSTSRPGTSSGPGQLAPRMNGCVGVGTRPRGPRPPRGEPDLLALEAQHGGVRVLELGDHRRATLDGVVGAEPVQRRAPA